MNNLYEESKNGVLLGKVLDKVKPRKSELENNR
jgi:hypothetical protein